jgi:predicted MFS family arabinose efflux permease
MTVTRKQLSPAWVLFILTGINLFNYLDRFELSAVLTPLQKELGINDGQAGRLGTAFMIGVIKPTSKVYRFVVAKPIRTGSM